jgi:hypothetical protein
VSVMINLLISSLQATFLSILPIFSFLCGNESHACVLVFLSVSYFIFPSAKVYDLGATCLLVGVRCSELSCVCELSVALFHWLTCHRTWSDSRT